MNTASKILLVALALNCSSLAIAVEYTFTRVYTGPAQPGVAINDNGLVALISNYSLITTDGHTSTIIASPTGPNSLADTYAQVLSLNNNGYVAFRGNAPGTPNWTYGILASNGTTTHKIAANFANGGSFEAISTWASSINDNGLVAFGAKPTGGNYRIYVGDGVSPTSEVNDHYGSVPAVNNAGTVVYRNGDTFTMEMQKGTELYSLPDVIAAHMPDINDSGTAAFFGGVEGVQKVVVWDGVSSPMFIDGSLYYCLTDGLVFDGGSPSCAINNQGLVVFGATTQSNPYMQGIFTGPDPVADKVIQAGDLLDGFAVETLSFSRNGLNNRGEIAFVAYLSDWTTGVWVATPVPEPSTLILLAAGAVSLLAYVWRRRVMQ